MPGGAWPGVQLWDVWALQGMVRAGGGLSAWSSVRSRGCVKDTLLQGGGCVLGPSLSCWEFRLCPDTFSTPHPSVPGRGKAWADGHTPGCPLAAPSPPKPSLCTALRGTPGPGPVRIKTHR